MLLAIAVAVVLVRRAGNVRWAREEALPKIMEAGRRGDYFTAFRMARKAELYIPGDPTLEAVWPQIQLC